ncbi:hypothetical protein [Propionimicrobium sp. PCR01-08-3]|uniref:hypothetical protein n=1 Tax=Propionimicrobium sp. PCR01-08-3 TaxID=3052086 RepID=UPI00255CF8AB|nr:hypothetical protein [Propionimicrobium sp. PCR01-08-3]WIY82838.1 hypothetical protein QQ658_00285 [Propionimicrobium sp. PCR01-08-3]
MKRIFASIATAVLIGAAVVGCGSSSDDTSSPAETPSAPATSASAPASSATPTGEATLTEENGLLVDTDKDANVIEGAGFDITIDPEAKTATFQQIDPASGEEFQNVDVFGYENGVFRRTIYVSAMGVTYVYYADLATGELQSIQNAAGEDVSEAAREQGHWDSAASGTQTERENIESYFEARYGMTIAEAVGA